MSGDRKYLCRTNDENVMFMFYNSRICVEENVIYFYTAPKYLARKRKFAGNFKIYVLMYV